MTAKARIVAALVRLYPAAWRAEYGPELTIILLARPLTARIIGDVLHNGLQQRVRLAEPSSLFGLAFMFTILAGFAWNIVAPPVVRHPLTDLLRHSSKTLPVVTVGPIGSDFYLLLLLWCGCWTELRRRGTLPQAGLAAMRVCSIASLPVVIAGVLMLSGVLGVAVIEPGQTPTSFREHGFTYTYYGVLPHAPTAWNVLISPLFRLPEAWLWGVYGGLLGRGIRRFRHRQPVA
jgi:hypothetical protein